MEEGGLFIFGKQMKHKYIFRLVTQDGKISFRKCFVDDSGEIIHVSSDTYTPTCTEALDVKSILSLLEAASNLPIITLPSAKGGWCNQPAFLDFLEED